MNVKGNSAYCRIDDRTVAAGEVAALQKVLERNGPAKLSDELTAAMSEVDFSKSVAAAMSTKNFANLAGGARAGPINLASMPGGADATRGAALQADIGNDIQLKVVALYKDAATADQMKKMAEGGVAAMKTQAAQMPPVAAKILNTVEFSASGAILRATATIDSDAVGMLVDLLGKGGMMPSDPNPAESRLAPAPQPFAGRSINTSPAAANSRPLASPFNAAGNAREAAGRAEASNNLKQVALAMHGYLAVEKHFPAPALCDPQGRPLLSWRVAILPYQGQSALYKQFRLDESWDGPNNKRLINRMPRMYRSPQGSKLLGIGKTCLLAPIGERAAFFGQQGRKVADFADGLTNTILVVEAAPERAIPWTKPDDLTIDAADPSAGLFGMREGVALAAFADGSVRFVPQATSKEALAALFTINGGETVPPAFGVK